VSNPFLDNEQSQIRLAHLNQLRELVGNAYPNEFRRSNILNSIAGEDAITGLVEKYGPLAPHAPEGQRPAPEDLARVNAGLNPLVVRIAGRLATPPRVMGKAAFVHLSDGKTRLQIYVRRDDVVGMRNAECGMRIDSGETETASDNPQSAFRTPQSVDGWELFNLLDHGDFVGVEGYLFVTKTGELSVHVQTLQFLAKALLPMPDKLHGIHDPELRQRQRYADLIAGSLKVELEPGELTPREVFERRAKVISTMRRILDEHGYVEVETPMLTPLATGAAARPFATHHNALDIPLYARIAPELYLKRLTVGGFERVYELNRNFRNEGLSHKHNPEFTMLEFYCAYMNVNGMMDFCEELLKQSVIAATGGLKVIFDGQEIDFSRFERISMRAAVQRCLPDAAVTGENLLELFEEQVEPRLIQPTFITDYPKAISPLSKASPENPAVAERFELFIAGAERANGFSELNDPAEQRERFLEQMAQRERGDDEAMLLDDDYIRALSYGMPPAAGIGIGIDRLVMLLTNRRSIRDVILFPHLRPERKAEEA
jgi:lysyl-tRNA synthetase class 2